MRASGPDHIAQPPGAAQYLSYPPWTIIKRPEARSHHSPRLAIGTEQPALSVSPFAAFLRSGPSNIIHPQVDKHTAAELRQPQISRLSANDSHSGSIPPLTQWTANGAGEKWLCGLPQNAVNGSSVPSQLGVCQSSALCANDLEYRMWLVKQVSHPITLSSMVCRD